MARPDVSEEEKTFYRSKLNYPGKSQQLQPCSLVLAPGVDDFEEQKEKNGVIGGLKPKLHPNDKKPLHDRLFAHAGEIPVRYDMTQLIICLSKCVPVKMKRD